METTTIGVNAGAVWNLLNENGKMEVAVLKKESGLTEAELWAAIGWLSREGKIAYAPEKVGKKTVKYFTLA